MAQCTAYKSAGSVCANGFFQVAACRQEVKCFTCGKPSEHIPHCLRDELPEHWITDEGLPRFYRRND